MRSRECLMVIGKEGTSGERSIIASCGGPATIQSLRESMRLVF